MRGYAKRLGLAFICAVMLAAPARLEVTPDVKSGEGGFGLGLEQAVLMALDNNRSLRIERINPAIAKAAEEMERAAFDPTLSAGYQYSVDKTLQQSRILGQTYDVKNERAVAQAGVSENLPTGTSIELSLSSTKSTSDLYGDYTYTRAGVSINQAILQGFGLDANLASLRQARLDTFASEYELKGFTQALAADVEDAYWDYALTMLELDIYNESLAIAQKHGAEVLVMIKVGSLPPIDQAASQAEAARTGVDLINARDARDQARLTLLRLLGLEDQEFLQKDITLLTRPEAPRGKLETLDAHLETALRMRPDINQAKLLLEKNELEITRTKNGLLPRLDFFVTLGKTGYSDSFNRSVNELDNGWYDTLVGMQLEYPIGGRAAKNEHEQASLQKSQADLAMQNLSHLAEVEVASAFLGLERARERVDAQAEVSRFQRLKAEAEEEKFKAGKSTSLLVAQAERDLLSSRVAEAEAVINCLKAFVKLYLAEGTLLERRSVGMDLN